MGRYRVAVYLRYNEYNTLQSTFEPTYIGDLDAEDFKGAAATALIRADITEYSIDDIFRIKNRQPNWEDDVHIVVHSLNKENYYECAYFYIWI